MSGIAGKVAAALDQADKRIRNAPGQPWVTEGTSIVDAFGGGLAEKVGSHDRALIVSVVNREARQIIQARGLLEMATSLQELRVIKPSLGDLGDGVIKGLAFVWCPEATT